VTKEQDHQPKPLTLEHVAQTATDVLLARGVHFPTLVVEGSQHATIREVSDLAATHEGRLRQLFAAGFVLASSGVLGDLKQIFFITEAWVSTAPPDQLKSTIVPSEDPARKEALVVSHLDAQTNEARIILREMIRDADGHLTEIRALHEDDQRAGRRLDSPLLQAFASGYATGRSGGKPT
jgi:hypothetical protein